MIESIFSTTATTTTTASAPDIASLSICIVFSLLMGALLAAVYAFRSRHTRSFTIALVVLPAIVCVVIAMVNGNIGAGVAVAGAFSLVRFRSVPGSGRDIAFVFLAMAIGLVAGMGYLLASLVVTLIIGAACLLLQLFGGRSNSSSLDRCIRITVPEDLDYANAFDEILSRYTTYHELASVKTTNMGSLFRLVYNVGLAPNADERALIDELRTRNGNLEIALTHQEVAPYEL